MRREDVIQAITEVVQDDTKVIKALRAIILSALPTASDEALQALLAALEE